MRLSTISSLLLMALLGPNALGQGLATPVQFMTEDGPVSLQSMAGKVVYVDFWASWCIPCRRSFPWLNRLQQRYAADGLVVIGVNVDAEPSQAAAFLQRYPANFTIAYDPQGRLAQEFDLQGMPSSFLFDRRGRLQVAQVGFRSTEMPALERRLRTLLEAAAP